MTWISRYFDSMAGRIFAVLLVGIVASASLALALADAKRRGDLDRLRLNQVAERTYAFVEQLNRTPDAARGALATEGGPGVRATDVGAAGAPDPGLTRLLRDRLGPKADARHVPLSACLGPPSAAAARRVAGLRLPPPQCWLVTVPLADGEMIRLAADAPPRLTGEGRGADPLYLGILAAAALALAFGVSRIAAQPLNTVARAAASLGRDLDRPQITARGPREVRAAAEAFNSMQSDLKRHVGERTQMLAAIAHDLQTPLTRMRLRLEKVDDTAVRDALIGDVLVMQGLVRDGLELARSEQAIEPMVRLDLVSLLESLVEDAADAGRPVTITRADAADVLARPLALRRCLENLIDNAVKYGDRAEVSAERGLANVTVRIRDHGPGVPADRIEELFLPFVRLEDSRSRDSGGTGLGLAIARRLAVQNGAALSLRNHPRGGLEAELQLPWPAAERPAPR
ncbi:MAG: two-component sensor histidine kinase [Phenylobacterium zucineum]|nr:MAG: two-component sensor histidine kinase [Phenylobacterium zucineum]